MWLYSSSPSVADTPANKDLKSDQSVVFLGHLGYLTREQEDAFATFKETLITAKLYTPASEGSPASHDDPTLLRFLRARGFQPKGALKHFAETEAWRSQHGVDRVYATFDPEEFKSAQRFYPRWTGRRDRNGVPLYVYPIRSVVPIAHELEPVSSERRFQRSFSMLEWLTRFCVPLASSLPHRSQSTPMSSCTYIADMQDVSLASMWRLRNHFQEFALLITANYPEILHHVAILNAPVWFSIIWGWLKSWFDEGTTRKIHILGNDYRDKLKELIDPKDLPREFGGELDWEFEDEPLLDEDAERAIGEMPKGPAVFVDGAVAKPTVP